MSHFDAVKDVPAGFTVVASTDVCPVAAMECPERKIYTTQFHPEVKHTEFGNQMLKNFLFDICGLEPNWTMDNLVETLTADFREKVGSDRVILALSGGVDSIHVHAEERYAKLLDGVTDPEQKRRIIGTQFWEEFFTVAQQLDGVKYLAQGTI